MYHMECSVLLIDVVWIPNFHHSAGCEGRGDIVCPKCNPNQEPGYYKENQMFQCAACYGRGLIAHRDGSDTMYVAFILNLI